jgi:hypothetical protein
MKPTTKIRFTEPQIALVMRAHPNCNLDRLTEVSFEFDQAGEIIDCIGTIKDDGNIDHNYAGSGAPALVRDGTPPIYSSTNQRNYIAISKRREAALSCCGDTMLEVLLSPVIQHQSAPLLFGSGKQGYDDSHPAHLR